MKLKKHLWQIATVLAIGTAGCNLFNPTESVDIKSSDAAALTYEGYLHYQKAEYSVAREYFDKAINADMAYSEAWYGKAKAVLNMQPGLNVFQLVSYANSSNANVASGFLTMPEEQATLIKNGIDSVMLVLDQFINLDTNGYTDGKVRFSNFSDSYSILRLTKVAIGLRSTQSNLNSIFSIDSSTGMHFDLSNLGSSSQEAMEAMEDFAAAAEALKANPAAGATIIKGYMPDTTGEWFTDKAYNDLTVGIANFVISSNNRLKETDASRLDVFHNYGDLIDTDGDGCVDEEVADGFDNDGDGEIDEDPRNSNVIEYEMDFTKYDISKLPVRRLKIIESYNYVDIDMDGSFAEDDMEEWEYKVSDPKQRKNNGDHLLKFAFKANFYSEYFENLSPEERIFVKEQIRHDTDINNIKYNLQDRKNMIGGCWNNYNQARFVQWFEGRNAQ